MGRRLSGKGLKGEAGKRRGIAGNKLYRRTYLKLLVVSSGVGWFGECGGRCAGARQGRRRRVLVGGRRLRGGSGRSAVLFRGRCLRLSRLPMRLLRHECDSLRRFSVSTTGRCHFEDEVGFGLRRGLLLGRLHLNTGSAVRAGLAAAVRL